jgi:hypothetical protein
LGSGQVSEMDGWMLKCSVRPLAGF